MGSGAHSHDNMGNASISTTSAGSHTHNTTVAIGVLSPNLYNADVDNGSGNEEFWVALQICV